MQIKILNFVLVLPVPDRTPVQSKFSLMKASRPESSDRIYFRFGVSQTSWSDWSNFQRLTVPEENERAVQTYYTGTDVILPATPVSIRPFAATNHPISRSNLLRRFIFFQTRAGR